MTYDLNHKHYKQLVVRNMNHNFPVGFLCEMCCDFIFCAEHSGLTVMSNCTQIAFQWQILLCPVECSRLSFVRCRHTGCPFFCVSAAHTQIYSPAQHLPYTLSSLFLFSLMHMQISFCTLLLFRENVHCLHHSRSFCTCMSFSAFCALFFLYALFILHVSPFLPISMLWLRPRRLC